MKNKNFINISILVLLPFITGIHVTNKNGSVNKTEQIAYKQEKVSPELPHYGREHVTDKALIPRNFTKINATKLNNTNVIQTSENTTNSINNITTPTKTSIHNSQITHSIVNNSSSSNHSLPLILIKSTPNTSTVVAEKPVAKKPLVTTHDYDQADSIPKKANAAPPNVNIDPFLSNRKLQRSNYVVPIVAIILSVPLVAAVMSILYKRGKDWWIHRNYRRMDYLIEGLYNS